MTAALGHLIMRHPDVKSNMENFLLQYVLPEFRSEAPYMRAIVCSFPCEMCDTLTFVPKACEVLGTVALFVGPVLPTEVEGTGAVVGAGADLGEEAADLETIGTDLGGTEAD